MSQRRYSSPPIVDAVIELRFATAIDDELRGRLSTRLQERYPIVEEHVQQTITLEARAEGRVDVATNERSFRRSDPNSGQVINIGGKLFGVATLAPYPGWDAFFGRFADEYRDFKHRCGYREITRIGVRYINRLDIDPNEKKLFDYEEYLNLRINLPEEFPPVFNYVLMFQTQLLEIMCGATVQSRLVPPAVPGKASFLLDIDVWREVDVPQKDADLYEVLQSMRLAKNKLFETFITEKARGLFDA